ncbi:MAG: FG-GAP repeat protein [Deltaproteobacteria bacterium]|nr:FG-GAP repeat protein [Deltaproteobacteria bacterium]
MRLRVAQPFLVATALFLVSSVLGCGDDATAPMCVTGDDCDMGECIDGRCRLESPADTGTPTPTDGAMPDTNAPGADAGPEPATPVVRWPWNGAATGSVHASGAVVAYPPLAPTFRWDAVMGATRYELQITSECETETYLSCAFASPTVDTSLPETVFRPAAELPASTIAPVGTRYFFRVRACTTSPCSGWSRVRYVDVGRSVQDFDGDGYADALVGARRQTGVAFREGAAWVLYGGPPGVAEPAREMPAPDSEVDAYFGVDLANLGDVNGDGYADAAVGAHQVDGVAVDSGRAYVYYGSETGLSAAPDVQLDLPVAAPMAYFGRGVTGLGDVNGDGYADLAVGAYGVAGATTGEGNVFVYYGSASGVSPAPGVTLSATDAQESEAFGVRVAAAGDVDGDGFSELLVSAYNWDADTVALNSGRFFLFHGSAAGVTAASSTVVNSPSPEDSGRFSYWVAGLGDVNGDSFGEVIVGARAENTRGRAYVFDGGPAGLSPTHSWMTDVQAASSLQYGFAAEAAGDLNGDGLADAVVTARHDDGTTANRGRAWVFHGTTAGLGDTPAQSLVGDPREGGAQFGFAAASAGDTNGDGFVDLFVGAINQDQGQLNEGVGYWYLGARGGIPATANVKVDHPENTESAQFGGSIARPIP